MWLTAVETILEETGNQLAWRMHMASKKRDLLEVLRLELEFLKGGGYRKSSSWRPQFIFEDSPTCLNYGDAERKRPCFECVLMKLVPEQFLTEKIPCRQIPLNEARETIHSLYQNGTSEELEAAVSEWLMNMIPKLELERAQGSSDSCGLSPKTSVGKA
jgi:hypothetical protein